MLRVARPPSGGCINTLNRPRHLPMLIRDVVSDTSGGGRGIDIGKSDWFERLSLVYVDLGFEC